MSGLSDVNAGLSVARRIRESPPRARRRAGRRSPRPRARRGREPDDEEQERSRRNDAARSARCPGGGAARPGWRRGAAPWPRSSPRIGGDREAPPGLPRAARGGASRPSRSAGLRSSAARSRRAAWRRARRGPERRVFAASARAKRSRDAHSRNRGSCGTRCRRSRPSTISVEPPPMSTIAVGSARGELAAGRDTAEGQHRFLVAAQEPRRKADRLSISSRKPSPLTASRTALVAYASLSSGECRRFSRGRHA